MLLHSGHPGLKRVHICPQIGVGIEAFQRIGDAFLLEPVCIVENKGLLRCYVHRLDLSVRYLRAGDQLEMADEKLLSATRFPRSAVRVNFVKPKWEWSYVEAGVRQRYSHVTHVPSDTVAVLVWAKLWHKKGAEKRTEDDFFTAQKVLVILGDQLFDGHDSRSEGHTSSNQGMHPGDR